ncbi:hypothetical protein JOQ06_015179, partial [Pogonophryne albipinna]
MGGMERRCGGGGGFIDPLFLCFPVLVARLEGTEQAESRVERKPQRVTAGVSPKRSAQTCQCYTTRCSEFLRKH